MLSEKVIPPNGEGEIKVTYSAGRRSGSQSKSVSVHTNDPENPKVMLKVHGQIKEAVVCNPSRLNFGNIVQGDSQARKIIVTAGEGEKAKVKDVESLSEHLKTDLSKNPEGEGYVVNVTLSPDVPRGRFSGQLRINTDNEHAPQITVSATANITGEIVVTPDRITLVYQKEEDNAGTTFSINKEREGAVAITKIECDVDHVITKLLTITEGKRYKVEVNATDQITMGRSSGTITLHTDSQDDPEIKVPLTVIVRGNLTLVPEKLSFGLIAQGDQRSKSITVSSTKGKLTIKNVECNLDFMKMEINEKVPGTNYQITIRVDSEPPVGSFEGVLTIHTNDSLQPTVEVSLNGKVRAKPSS